MSRIKISPPSLTTKPDGTQRKLLDASRIKALGWQPEIGLEERVKKVYGEMVDGEWCIVDGEWAMDIGFRRNCQFSRLCNSTNIVI